MKMQQAHSGGQLPVSHGHQKDVSQTSGLEAALVRLLTIALGCDKKCRHDDVKIGDWLVDFACENRENRLVVQYDGSHHHRPLRRAARDRRCARQLRKDGWRVLRVRSDALPRIPGRGMLVVRDRAGIAEVFDKTVDAIQPWIDLDTARVAEARRAAALGVKVLAGHIRAALSPAESDREELRQLQARVRNYYENNYVGLRRTAEAFGIPPSTTARYIVKAGGRLRSRTEAIALHKEYLNGWGASHPDLRNPARLARLLEAHGSVAAVARNIKCSQRTVSMAAREWKLLDPPVKTKRSQSCRLARVQLASALLLVASAWAMLILPTRRRLQRQLRWTQSRRAEVSPRQEKTPDEARGAVVAWLQGNHPELLPLFVDVVQPTNPVARSMVRVLCPCGAEHVRRLYRFAVGEPKRGLKPQRRCQTCARKRELSEPRRRILAWLDTHPQGGTPKKIAEDLGLSEGSVRQLLSKMKRDGLVTTSAYGWYLPAANSPDASPL